MYVFLEVFYYNFYEEINKDCDVIPILVDIK